MAQNTQNDPLGRLVACLSRLPGVGRRSAERMAIRLVRNEESLLDDTVSALQEARRSVSACSLCGSITPAAENPCRLCTARNRDDSVMCVVEDPSEISIIEKSGGFRGRYHALMGKLSPMRGDGPDNIRIKALLERLDKGGFAEVVLALSTDVEGDSTAMFIADLLKDRKLKISRLASGLPAGSGIVYSDPVTLARAMKHRTVETD